MEANLMLLSWPYTHFPENYTTDENHFQQRRDQTTVGSDVEQCTFARVLEKERNLATRFSQKTGNASSQYFTWCVPFLFPSFSCFHFLRSVPQEVTHRGRCNQKVFPITLKFNVVCICLQRIGLTARRVQPKQYHVANLACVASVSNQAQYERTTVL